MKVLCLTFLIAVFSSMVLSGCTLNSLDPIATGEVIGITYTLTKDQLNDTDRENIEAAYSVFCDLLEVEDKIENGNVKGILFVIVDEKIDDIAKRAAIKLVITLYWDKLQSNIDVDSMPYKDQIEVLKQVKIGIERGLGV